MMIFQDFTPQKQDLFKVFSSLFNFNPLLKGGDVLEGGDFTLSILKFSTIVRRKKF